MAKTDKNNASTGKGLGAKLAGMTDTNLLLTITIAVFFPAVYRRYGFPALGIFKAPDFL